MDGYTGNDEVSNQEEHLINTAQEKLVEQLFAQANDADKMKAFLNTVEGRAIRETLAKLQFAALQDAVASDPETRAEARYSHDVWKGVEQVFAVIITEGAAALEQLKLIQQSHQE